MPRNLEYEALKDAVKYRIKSLRFVYKMIDKSEDRGDEEPCLRMTQSFIKEITDNLESDIKD